MKSLLVLAGFLVLIRFVLIQPTWLICTLVSWLNGRSYFNIVCSLENPANSIFWLIPFVVKMLQKIGGYETLFHNCRHGGLRRKLTKWWDTHGIFDELAAICENDGSHEDLDWKPVTADNKLHYPTSSEAAYPFLLCTRLVDSVKSKLTESDLDPQNLQEQIEVEDKNSHPFILGMLPRGKKFRQLVSEFEHYIECYIKPRDDNMLNSFLSKCPKGSRAASRQCLKSGDVDKTFLDTNTSLECRVEKVSVGIPRNPLIFATKAFLQVILEAWRFICHNRCKMLSMQISLTSRTLLQRRHTSFFTVSIIVWYGASHWIGECLTMQDTEWKTFISCWTYGKQNFTSSKI